MGFEDDAFKNLQKNHDQIKGSNAFISKGKNAFKGTSGQLTPLSPEAKERMRLAGIEKRKDTIRQVAKLVSITLFIILILFLLSR